MRTTSLLMGLCAAAALSAVSGQAMGTLVNYVPVDAGTATYNQWGVQTALTTDTPAGLPGYAMAFPSSGGNWGPHIDLPSSSSTFALDTAGQAMTISAWVKSDGTATNDQGLVCKYDDSTLKGWGLTLTTAGKLKFGWTEAGNYGGSRLSSATLTAGTWSQVAMSWTAGNSEGLKFYVNGQDAGISLSYVGTPMMVTNALNIRMGTLDQLYNAFRGSMDDVAMWDTALSAGKIRSLATAPAVLSGYDAGKMQQLFALYDNTTAGATDVVGGQTWGQATGLTGHAAGDVWQVGADTFMQFDASGGGVTTAVPEPASITLLGVGSLIALRRRRA